MEQNILYILCQEDVLLCLKIPIYRLGKQILQNNKWLHRNVKKQSIFNTVLCAGR